MASHTRIFAGHTDADLVRYWNEGDGAIAWLNELELELERRGYQARTTDPDDPRPRTGERLILSVDDGERWSTMSEEGLTLWRENIFNEAEAKAFVRSNPTTGNGKVQIAAPERVIREAADLWEQTERKHETAKAQERRRLVSELLEANGLTYFQ